MRQALLLTLFIIGWTPLAPGEEQPVFPLNLLQDQGRFTYYVNEEKVGTSDFKWLKDGSFRSTVTVRIAGKEISGYMGIFVNSRGQWTSVDLNAYGRTIEITRQGGSALLSTEGREIPLRLDPGSLLMEDMSPALMSQAVFAYDRDRGGKQKLPVLFLPSTRISGSLEFLDRWEDTAGGKVKVFERYRYELPPVYTVDLVVDEARRVCWAGYPAQHGVFVREGFEHLMAPTPSDPTLSKPVFSVIEEPNTAVPMRDGLALATDIYRPDGQGKHPVIVARTPYKKESGRWKGRFYARRGYVFAVQDVRGRFASPGEWTPFMNEAEDGFDTIEWLASQPWSNGRVGMIGGSYLGWVQFWAASLHPPHLVTLIPNVAPPEPGYNFPYENGVFFLSAALWWCDVVEGKATADISGIAMEESFEIFDDERLKQLPVIDLDEKVTGKKIPYFREWIAHPDHDGYWKKTDFIEAMKGLDIPIYHQSGWFDGNGMGAKRNYLELARQGASNQKLVIGPWGHTDEDRRFDDKGRDWGEEAIVDLQGSYLRWMDRWLKGIENGIDEEPSVSLFIMGSNRWLHGDTYPLEETRMTPLYLSDEGRMTFEPPGSGPGEPDRFVYDPGDPTPDDPTGREDLLIYRSAPLEEPLTFAGPVTARLFAASSAPDTDWIVRLARVDGNGRPLVLAHGALRARYRDSLSKPKLLEPGKVYEYGIDMWHTGYTLQPGEVLTLVISSAQFPRYSRNLNTGGPNETGTDYSIARQSVFHDRERPSRILLPLIPHPLFERP